MCLCLPSLSNSVGRDPTSWTDAKSDDWAFMNRVDQTALFNPLPDARSDGSSDSFEAFHGAESTRLFRGLFLLIRNAHEAEELMQPAFFKIWERWERVSGLKNVDSRLMFPVPTPGGKP
jgi:hypothetical protein